MSVFENSFVSHPKSVYWSSKNILKPCDITKGTHKKYWFNCDKCEHLLFISIHNITYLNRWCAFCANKKLCENLDCKDCFEKSFASQSKSQFWSNNNELNPRQVFKSSSNKYIFNCDKCNHFLEMGLDNITNNNYWCKYCSNPPQKLCDDETCKDCFNKSFASHPKSKYWSDDNEINPRQIFKCSNKKFKFDCNICNNTFLCSLGNISNNRWCSICKHKTELKLFNWLNEKNFNVESQVKFDWCKIKRRLPYDFVIENLKIIIELDGIQHFEQVSNWKSPKQIQENDEFKNKSALDNGYRMIRIFQEIVLFEKEDWGNQLNEAINSKKNLIKIGKIYV